MERVIRLWKLLPDGFRWNLEDTFQPEDISDRLLPGEQAVLEIRPAWYRDIFGTIVFRFIRWIFLLALLLILLVFYAAFQQRALPVTTSLLYSAVPFVLFIIVLLFGIKERIAYNQWRILKTNARLIISQPQKNAFPLVDNIELDGLPKVLDTNWSPRPLWRIFQFFTGARDLYLSMTAFKFVDGTAKAGDAIVIPDVMPNDVFELKQLVFKVK
ncbi:MAG: hypothetical protein KDE56_24020 [Anaerolineales bacterium]|nr:hypothetical protein [Anaerolineales bacterium]